MKKIFGIIALCAMLIGGAAIAKVYADGETCREASGVSMTISDVMNCRGYVVARNSNNYNCSASCDVYIRINGEEHFVTSVILAPKAKSSDDQYVSYGGKCGNYFMKNIRVYRCD